MDIKIELDVGLDDASIQFYQQLEKEIDRTMLQFGFSRKGTGKEANRIVLIYHRFAIAL